MGPVLSALGTSDLGTPHSLPEPGKVQDFSLDCCRGSVGVRVGSGRGGVNSAFTSSGLVHLPLQRQGQLWCAAQMGSRGCFLMPCSWGGSGLALPLLLPQGQPSHLPQVAMAEGEKTSFPHPCHHMTGVGFSSPALVSWGVSSPASRLQGQL